MRKPRRIYLLPLMAFSLMFFGATDKCNYTWCLPGLFGAPGGCGEGGGGPGGGGGPAPTATYPPLPTATSIPTPGATPIAQLYGIAPYTYSQSQCWQGQEIDPINVVFTINATVPNVLQHAADHGSWTYGDGSTQSFWQDGDCFLMNAQMASGSAVQLPGRFHMRILSGNVGPPLGIIAVADAHHEDIGLCPLPQHVVDHEGDNGGVSGFDMGRNDIVSNWQAGGHTVTLVVWNNIRSMMQCDGRTSKSDGRTVFVSVN